MVTGLSVKVAGPARPLPRCSNATTETSWMVRARPHPPKNIKKYQYDMRVQPIARRVSGCVVHVLLGSGSLRISVMRFWNAALRRA